MQSVPTVLESEEDWPQCENCGQLLYDFTEYGDSWLCLNSECEEYDQ